jgi:hypothetical protein
MGGRKLNLSSTVILLGMILTTSGGCGMLTESTETPVSPIQQESPTLSANNATPATTATPTHTRIPTSPPARTRIPTSTMPFIPTLPTEEAGLRLLDLLANNGDCRLPCLWGITPGISNTKEARNILMPLSSLSYRSHFDSGIGVIQPVFTEKDLEIVTDLGFLSNADNDLISRISFSAGVYREIPDPNNPENLYPVPIDGSTPIGKKIVYYMLSNILSENGRPSSVLIQTLARPVEDPDSGPFDMLLLYPDQGIFIYYGLNMRLSGTNILGCPENNYVKLELFPSGNAESFMEFITPLWGERLPYYKPVEEVTSMSLDEFYETFRQPTDQCMVTPSNLWPEPGR